MNFNLILSFLSIFLIKSVFCVQNITNEYNLEMISMQTNCSFNDLKCINSRKLLQRIANISRTLSDNNNNNNSNIDTFVKLCVSGETYYDLNQSQCMKCSVDCPDNSRVQKKCNETHDTQCVCNSGYFMALSDNTCKPCSQCESGWGIWRSCRGSRNTVCRKCPPGTFSGVQTGTLGCILCTKCNSEEVMIEECSGVHDSICIDKRKLKYSLNYIKEDNFTEDDGNALPLYFGLLVIIVLVLITYVIIQLRIKQMVKTTPNFKYQQNFKYPVAYHNIHNIYNKGLNERQYNFNQFVKTNKVMNNSIICTESPKNSLIVKRYNELNTSVRRAFEIKLNNESKSWKSLAKELGYTNASISAFESLGRQRLNSTQYFLNDWSKYEDSTIHSLIKALQRIRRIDCVLVIDPSFRATPY